LTLTLDLSQLPGLDSPRILDWLNPWVTNLCEFFDGSDGVLK